MNPIANRPSLRVLHTSDLHLLTVNDRRCDGLVKVIDKAIEYHVDLLLVVGDLFDETRVKDDLIDFTVNQFKRLNIPVILLPGNHDCLVPGSVLTKTGFWQTLPHVFIVRQNGGEVLDLPNLAVSIWGNPIDTYNDLLPLQGMPWPEADGHWNIALAHGWVVESAPLDKRAFLIMQDDLIDTGWDYIALGHIPRFQIVCDRPIACYSGSPTESNTMALVELDGQNGVRVECLTV